MGCVACAHGLCDCQQKQCACPSMCCTSVVVSDDGLPCLHCGHAVFLTGSHTDTASRSLPRPSCLAAPWRTRQTTCAYLPVCEPCASCVRDEGSYVLRCCIPTFKGFVSKAGSHCYTSPRGCHTLMPVHAAVSVAFAFDCTGSHADGSWMYQVWDVSLQGLQKDHACENMAHTHHQRRRPPQ
jgi:hypothetical protein